MEEVVLAIEDMNLLKEKFVYLLKLKGTVVYVGVCNYGVSFMYAHKGKEFDSAYILKVPQGKDAEMYKDELILKYAPEYNLNAEYVKKPKIDIIEDEDMISLSKVRDVLVKSSLDYLYPNNSEMYSKYIEYTFVKKHKLATTKYNGRSFISLTDFRNIMLEEHDVDISRFIS